MRDELVHLQSALEVVSDEIGQLRAPLDAAKGAAFPYAARHQLECCMTPHRSMCQYLNWTTP